MKQHVTPKQLQDVTEDEFYSLFDEIVKRKDWANYHHKKMSVGKMIELLNDNSQEVDIKTSKNKVSIIVSNKEKTESIEKFKCVAYKPFLGTELCDVLWETIKKIIIKK